MSVTGDTVKKLLTGVEQYLNGKWENRRYSIKSLSVEMPCSAEDNFLSEIYAIKVGVNADDGGDESGYPDGISSLELIGKSQITSGDDSTVRRYLYNLIFTKEMLLYSSILQRMESMLRGIGRDNPCLSPKLHHHYTEGESYSCLFFDNLVSQQFYLPQTHGAGLQVDECHSIMRAIARFHALSIVMEGEEGVPIPQQNEVYTVEFFLSEDLADSTRPLVQNAYDGIVLLAEQFRPDLAPLLKDFDKEESVWSRLCKLVKPGTTSFACLCHGDPRLNNIFLGKNDVSSVRFIDFQLTRYASPITDLQYILHMGTTKDFREKHTGQVLQTYFDEFTSVLNSFPTVTLLPTHEAAVRGWSLEKLMQEYEAMTNYGFLISMTLLPLALTRPHDIDKSVGQMGKEERSRFWTEGRKDMVVKMGRKHADVRGRLFDICDDALDVWNKQQRD